MSDTDLGVWGRIKRRSIAEPWIPIGGLATVGVLLAATFQMRKGNLVSANHLLRLRVATQGATVTAMLIGSYLTLNQKRKANERDAAAKAAKVAEQATNPDAPKEKEAWEIRLDRKLAQAEYEKEQRAAAAAAKKSA